MSPAKDLVLTNKAGVPLSITIAASRDFAVSARICASSVGPLASCTIAVVFKPATIGARSGTLRVTGNAPNSPQASALSGTGTWVTVAPAGLSFGSQKVGTTGAPKSVTFTNKAASLIFISNITASGHFAPSSTTCGSSLGAGSSCSVSVTFIPKTSGQRIGTLTVEASAPLPSVGLSGTGSP
jgi:hypothetical protein